MSLIGVDISEGGFLPVKATDGSAGYDLFLKDNLLLTKMQDLYRCQLGVRLAIPNGYCGIILPRSSMHRYGLSLGNTVGLIDSDYRGEIILVLKHDKVNSGSIKKGTRLAQIVFMPVPEFNLLQVTGLDQTSRSDGGFGSTGV